MGGVRGTWLVLCYDLDFLFVLLWGEHIRSRILQIQSDCQKKTHDTISFYLGSMLVLGMFDSRGLWPELAFPKTLRSRGTSPAPLFSHKWSCATVPGSMLLALAGQSPERGQA